MSEFLNDLKKSIDDGKFNSDAAKKINLIDEEANHIDPNKAEKLIEKRLKESGTKVSSEEDVVGKNLEYDKKMEDIKHRDVILQQIATIQEMEHMVSLSVQDMFEFLKTLETNFNFDEENETNKELYDEIKRVKEKFSSIIP